MIMFLATAVQAQSLSLAEFAGRPGWPVLFIRHALAPGTGDPPGFELEKCDSQRNLDQAGRLQAKAIGRQLAAAGIKPGIIYSSQWCRCLETARLLDLGPVTALPGLNSFYQNIVPRGDTLAQLRVRLASLPADRVTVMVTHFVTIQAITGLGVSSGGLVGYDPASGRAAEIRLEGAK